MKFLEEDLEQMIWEASGTPEGRDKLYERGLHIKSLLYRQVSLGSYGYTDLLGVSGKMGGGVILQVIELKKGELNCDHLMQLCRYITGLNRHISKHLQLPYEISIEAGLIGKSVKSSSDFVFLIDRTDVGIYTYEFDLEDGLIFNQPCGWKRNDETFSDELEDVFNGISTELDEEYLDFVKDELERKKHEENGQKTHR